LPVVVMLDVPHAWSVRPPTSVDVVEMSQVSVYVLFPV
jgi:hypothetical protein